MMRGHGRWMPRLPVEEGRPIRRRAGGRVVATFGPYRSKVALVGLAIVVTATLGVINPLLIKHIFDHALFGNPPGRCDLGQCPNLATLYRDVALMIAIPVISGVIGTGQTPLANVVGLRVMQDFRNG